MKKEKILAIIALILVLLLVSFYLFRTLRLEIVENEKESSAPSNNSPEAGDSDSVDSNKGIQNGSSDNLDKDILGGSSGGSGGGGSSSKSGNSEQNQTNLPGDIEQVDCGLYFEQYNVCKGSCPSGTCVADGRSCYCQKF